MPHNAPKPEPGAADEYLQGMLGYTPIDDRAEVVLIIEVRLPLLDTIKHGEDGIERALDELRAAGSAEIVSVGVHIPRLP